MEKINGHCPKCGGTHYGSHECPFISLPCAVCGEETIMACSDCAIDTGESVHVCGKRECRDLHEACHTKARLKRPKADDVRAARHKRS